MPERVAPGFRWRYPSYDRRSFAISLRSASLVEIAEVVELISPTDKANYLLRQALDRKTGRFARRANQMVVSKYDQRISTPDLEHCGGRRSFSV
jgi:hypothetical protein